MQCDAEDFHGWDRRLDGAIKNIPKNTSKNKQKAADIYHLGEVPRVKKRGGGLIQIVMSTEMAVELSP